ncbi:DUF721 domain-containing protein [Legionella spiritensis]|uniref:DUF721 domain-containing protein n=1 Tax=Legionella spiritensis TaxID=452 RepID=A0A0W0Z694_LEGSP|nr:DUF721 domain-containing protein [Legionella spiritensis]KTD64633.1 hypothetical protein Lspi_0800 [Legionella spiritensis]SNV47518.1 Zn-ribbon-containing, possible RNA-binding protein-like protein [Legionella spiritensis]
MRKINQCLNRQILEICQKSVQLDTLNALLHSYLKPHLRDHCRAGSFNKGCLVVITTNPAFATELRYELPDIRDKLRREAGLYQLSSIQIKIIDMQETWLKPQKPTNQPALSPQARQAILMAGDLCHYPPLKKALANLGSKRLLD